jgi:WD40 repeat protein
LPSTPERQRSGDGGPEPLTPHAQRPTVLADLGQGGGRLPGSADGCGVRLASASADGTVRVWDVATGEELLSISTHPSGVGRVAFSHECVSPPEGGPERCGTRLITANSDNTVRVYLLSIEELIALAHSRVTRGLTDEECQQYLHVEGCPE